jgi:hypothetical protein
LIHALEKRLFNAKKRESVISWINALKRLFIGGNVKDAAIRGTFYGGARKDINDIVLRHSMSIKQLRMKNMPKDWLALGIILN